MTVYWNVPTKSIGYAFVPGSLGAGWRSLLRSADFGELNPTKQKLEQIMGEYKIHEFCVWTLYIDFA